MKAVSKILAGGAMLAALASAAPAAAQYNGYGYGGYGNGYDNGYGYSNGGSVVGQILNSILGGRNYAVNDRNAIDLCVRATEARINGYQGSYGYNTNYGNYGGYGSNGYAPNYSGGRVTSITQVERRSNGLKISGYATVRDGGNGAYGYGNGYGNGYNNGYNNPYNGYGNGYSNGYGNGNGYNAYNQGYGRQVSFNCKSDYRGQVYSVHIDHRDY